MAKFKIKPVRNLKAEFVFPGDKSISHRAIIFSSIAGGRSKIVNLCSGDDVLRTLNTMKMLGAEIEKGKTVFVSGRGLNGLKEPGDVIYAGNSGTTARLLTGLLAGQNFFSVITGDDSLKNRPMERVVKPLREMGADINGRKNGAYLPLSINGKRLTGADIASPVASAQVKSAILLAGLFADGRTSVTQPAPSRDHTERMLKFMGIDIQSDGKSVSITGGGRLESREIHIPGDISSAAFFIVAGTIVKGSELILRNVGLNPFRTGIVEILKRMGADIEIEDKKEDCEPSGTLIVKYSRLKGTTIEGNEIPMVIDEIPVIAVAGAVAEGETVIRTAEELRKKESDRITAMVTELRKMGVDIQELPDGMKIRGGQLKGAVCDSYRDHRVGMALAVAGMVAKGETSIEGSEWIAISFPEFRGYLKKLMK
ncbi:MAG TPA: 3-phosphoshikimate 1-carboxyvinyltransferase [bacterium]